MTKPLSYRTVNLIAAILIGALLSISVYLQFLENMTPCPLCLLQRGTLLVLGFVFFLAVIFYRQSILRKLLSSVAFICSLIGVILSGRQVWLQHLPPVSGATCETSLSYMFHVLPLQEVIIKIFQGGAECAETGEQFLYLNLAEWSLCWFVLFLLLSVWQLLRK